MAGIEVSIHSVPSGETPYAVLQQSTGGLGTIWDFTGGSWVASPSTTDRKLTLVQDAEVASSWDAQTGTLGAYTGQIMVHFFDSTDTALGSAPVDVVTGDMVTTEAGDATLANQTTIISTLAGLGGVSGLSQLNVDETLTWQLLGSSETGISPQVVTIDSDEVVTIAMDFSERLHDESLATVATITDSEGALTFDPGTIDKQYRRAHIDITAGLVAGVTHTIEVACTTNTGQTRVGKGTLQVV